MALLALPAPAFTASDLEFDRRQIVLNPEVHETGALLEFHAINNGTDLLEIVAISVPCSCMASDIDQRLLQPGERSLILIHYSFGTTVGSFRHPIKIFYSNSGDETLLEIDLLVVGDIPSPLEFSQREISWRDAEPASEKTLRVAVRGDYGA